MHWNLSRRELQRNGPDHIMKLRYTSLQVDAGTDELVHPEAADASLDGVPVVACSLHSQMAVVAATIAAMRPEARIAYVMTDGAALPLARHVLAADAIVVAMGPGVVGTGTSLGTTSVEVAQILDLARKMGGTPVLAVRASDGDGRTRHQGISHHTETAARLCFARPLVVQKPRIKMQKKKKGT